MVFACLCHSVATTPCRLLYSVVYGEDMQTAVKQGVSADGLRKIRKDQLLEVACRVQSEWGFRWEAKDKVPKGSVLREDISEGLPNYEKGYFRLLPNDPFTDTKTVLWLICDGVAFVLILEQDENRLLAEVVLSLIAKLAHEYIMCFDQKAAEVLLKAEKMSTVLQVVLPNGQLIFMNHKLIKQFEKQVDVILSK